jgi:hypothetical protein
MQKFPFNPQHLLFIRAEFLDVIGQKSLEFSFLLFTVTSTNVFYSPLPPPQNKSGLKLVCNVNIVYGNLKSENSQYYAQKPQQNWTFMSSASGLNTFIVLVFSFKLLCSPTWFLISPLFHQHVFISFLQPLLTLSAQQLIAFDFLILKS